MRLFVTGSRGFTGRYIKLLCKNKNIEIFESISDILDKDNLLSELVYFKPTHVCHLAAISFANNADHLHYYNINLLGTLNLLECLKESNLSLENVIISSSASVYGNKTNGVINENTQFDPHNHYSVSKVSVEFVCNLYREYFPITVTRPFNYTGVGQASSFLLPKIVYHYKNKLIQIELGNIDVYREFNDVRDVANAYWKILNSKSKFKFINICSGNKISVRDILNYTESLSNHSLNVCVNSEFVRKNDPQILVGDSTILRQNFNYVPQFSIQNTIEWMLLHDTYLKD